MDEPLPPGLYVVAKPIGISATCRCACRRNPAPGNCIRPDKRVAPNARLAERRAPRAVYNDSSEAEQANVARLGSDAVALISDAGTAPISTRLQDGRRARAPAAVPACPARARQSPRGPSPDANRPILFLGFLPAKAQARGEPSPVAGIRATLVLRSGPRSRTPRGAGARARDRRSAVAREISNAEMCCPARWPTPPRSRDSAEGRTGDRRARRNPSRPRGRARRAARCAGSLSPSRAPPSRERLGGPRKRA